MAESQDKVTTSEGETAKLKASPDAIAHRRAVKRLAFHVWRQDWRKANPEGTPEQRKAAWAEAAREERRKLGKALRLLEKRGFKLVEAQPQA